MTNVWVDANVLLRFLTGDIPDQARRARRLLRRAEAGQIVLQIPSVVIAEVVWVLGSVYDVDRPLIADRVRTLVLADGVAVQDRETVVDALRIMEEANVAYVDAYLAAVARRRDEPIATFDLDFRRLGVRLLENTTT